MTIGEIVRQGLHYARTCRSLWLFGFFVGMASGGSGGGGGGGDGGGVSVGAFGVSLPVTEIASIAIVIVLALVALIVMRFVSEHGGRLSYTLTGPTLLGWRGALKNDLASGEVESVTRAGGHVGVTPDRR